MSEEQQRVKHSGCVRVLISPYFLAAVFAGSLFALTSLGMLVRLAGESQNRGPALLGEFIGRSIVAFVFEFPIFYLIFLGVCLGVRWVYRSSKDRTND